MAALLDRLSGVGIQTPAETRQPTAPSSPTGSKDLSFSKHLMERMSRRNLDISAEGIDRLAQAVDKAAGKGSRDSVVFLDDLALLVNVPSRTVVTAIDTRQMKEGVFTNIDTVVMG